MSTAAAFGDVTAEFAALRTACGVYRMDWRCKLIVSGEDRARWLNGMVTNNIKDLPVNCGNYNFLLSPRGRILGDMYIYNRGNYTVIDTDVEQKRKLLEIFNKFIIMDDVEVSDASDKLAAIGLRGPHSQQILQSAGIDEIPSEGLDIQNMSIQDIGVSVVSGLNEQFVSFEIWAAPQNITTVWDLFIRAGATPVGSEAFELARIANGTPRYGADMSERDLPQETAQTQALNFSKGCYVGQEIVERIHSRGILHRTFTGFVFSGNLPAPGSKIQFQGKDVGEIMSVAALPFPNAARNVGLGYLRREVAVPGTEVRVGDLQAVVANFPF